MDRGSGGTDERSVSLRACCAAGWEQTSEERAEISLRNARRLVTPPYTRAGARLLSPLKVVVSRDSATLRLRHLLGGLSLDGRDAHLRCAERVIKHGAILSRSRRAAPLCVVAAPPRLSREGRDLQKRDPGVARRRDSAP